MDEIRQLDEFLKHFHREYSGTSVAALRVYLVVCHHALLGTPPETLPSLGEIAEKLGIPRPTLTHIIQMFSDGSRKIGPPQGSSF
jgi:DNA-binding MarR family transcriptional regulator